MKVDIKKGEKSQITLTGEIPADVFESYREKAITNVGKHVKIDGFREGKVPENILVEKVGEMAILEEMSQLALMTAYPKILTENEIDAIGRPDIQITKIAAQNPLGFVITTTVMPEIKAADYKKIAKKAMSQKLDDEVTDTEIEDAVKQLLRMRAHGEKMKNLEEGAEPPKMTDITDEELPELNDETVKEIGKFESVDDFKAKLRENMQMEKEGTAKEKRRIEMIEQIIEKSDVDVPDMMVKYELDKMMAQMEHDISMTGMKVDEYLEKIEKTRESLREEWNDDAVKRAKMQLILNHIAVTEKVEPSDEEVEAEVAKIMEMYKDMKDVSENNARGYVATMLTNQKVFEFLESQG